MARPIDLEKRQQILQEALRLLGENGARGLNMKSLAKAAGMKRSTLYWYFSDLAAVFEAALESLVERVTRHLVEKLDFEKGHPIDLLYQRHKVMHEFFGGFQEEIFQMLQLWSAGGSEPRKSLEGIPQMLAPIRQDAVLRLQAGIENGQVHPCDPLTVVQFVGALSDGALIDSLAGACEPEPLLEYLWKTVLQPLKREDPP